LIGLLAGGCGSGGDGSDGSSAPLRVTNPHGTLHARQGQAVVLSFASQPGVGYGWSLVANAPAGVLAKRGERFVPRNSSLVGGPGSEQFTFRAARSGTAGLRFRHDYRGRTLGTRAVRVVVAGG
jgi:predicted secreted protein